MCDPHNVTTVLEFVSGILSSWPFLCQRRFQPKYVMIAGEENPCSCAPSFRVTLMTLSFKECCVFILRISLVRSFFCLYAGITTDNVVFEVVETLQPFNIILLLQRPMNQAEILVVVPQLLYCRSLSYNPPMPPG